LEESVGGLPTISPPPVSEVRPATQADEDWAVRAAKNANRFSDKPKENLLAKFRIGQTTGQKLDAEVVVRGADCLRLFKHQNFFPQRSPLIFPA